MMRSPVAVYERREKSRAGIATRWLQYKGRRLEEGLDKAGAMAKTSRRSSLSVLMAWRQFISCRHPGGPDLSFWSLSAIWFYHRPRRYQCTYRFPDNLRAQIATEGRQQSTAEEEQPSRLKSGGYRIAGAPVQQRQPGRLHIAEPALNPYS